MLVQLDIILHLGEYRRMNLSQVSIFMVNLFVYFSLCFFSVLLLGWYIRCGYKHSQ